MAEQRTRIRPARTRRGALRGALALALLLGVTPVALASGTYTGRPGQPPSSVDRASYELGKKIFAGEYAGGASADAEAQRAELEALEQKLPPKARQRAHFVPLAGRLSDEEVASLRYFLKKRYRVE